MMHEEIAGNTGSAQITRLAVVLAATAVMVALSSGKPVHPPTPVNEAGVSPV